MRPLLEDDHAVALPERAQAVGDDERRAALHGLLHRGENFVLGVRIDRGGRIVEQQNRRIEQHGPGDRQPLPLPAGKIEAPFAEHRVVAVRQRGDEVVGGGDFGGLFDLGQRRLGMAEGDVGGDRVAEEERLLKHQADVPPQVVEIEIAQVVPVEQDPAAASDRRTGRAAPAASSCPRRSRRESPRSGPAR